MKIEWYYLFGEQFNNWFYKMKSLTIKSDSELLKSARGFTEQYRLIIGPAADGGFLGSSYEMPNVLAHGSTPEQCVADLRDALEAAVAILLRAGETPPSAKMRAARTEQINVRLTSEERHQIDEAARMEGFRGASEFVRSTVLTRLRKGD